MNKFYDPKLESTCKEAMRNLLLLYFEFGFRIDIDNVDPSIVAKTNDLYLEVEEKDISMDRLRFIYSQAVGKFLSADGIKNFCLLPILFSTSEYTEQHHE